MLQHTVMLQHYCQLALAAVYEEVQCRKKTHRCGKDGGDNQLHLESGFNLMDASGRLQVSGNQSGE